MEDDTVEIADNSDDSDVVVVGETTPAQPITIDLVDSNSDSDEPILVSSTNDHVGFFFEFLKRENKIQMPLNRFPCRCQHRV